MSESPSRPVDREEIAKREIGQTVVSPGMCVALVVFFIGTIVGVPLIQQSWEAFNGEVPQAFSIVEVVPDAARSFAGSEGTFIEKVFAVNGELLRSIQRYEEELEDKSFLAHYLIPRMQQVYAQWMGLGNEQVYLGREGWLFYRPGVDYLTGPGFLDADFQKRRIQSGDASMGAAIQPDPVKAIVDFRDQLEARGIHLIVMPVPVKAVIHPEMLSSLYDELAQPIQNPSYESFLGRLALEGVDVFDVTDRLWEMRAESGSPQFLATDTHWTPQAMESSARGLAEYLRERFPSLYSTHRRPGRGVEVVEGMGDVATMLRLPEESAIYPVQRVEIHPISEAEFPQSSNEGSPILLLGDSFSNIYSLGEMGWGASAGFAEQLSYYWEGPVDTILRNDAGAFATRERLAADLARGKNRLSGKAVVVWEFAMRELSVGDWKMVTLPEIEENEVVVSTEGGFFVPPSGERVEVEGTVMSCSVVPRPGTVPYKDQIFSVHLSGLTGSNVPAGSQAMVYLFGMIDNTLTVASSWEVGDRVKLVLRDWGDVAADYDRLNRSEPEDFELQLEAPAWGEPASGSEGAAVR